MLQIHGYQSPLTTQLVQTCGDINLGLRWGGQQVQGAVNGSVHLLNGLEQLQALQAAGVSCPEVYSCSSDDEDSMRGSIFLARKLNHTQGKDIIVVGSPKQRKRRHWIQSDFCTKYYPAVTEWRLHVIKFARGYRVIARSLKIWSNDGPEPTTHPIIRSRRLGWHMDHTQDPPKGLREICKQAIEACGYELGAVDVLDLGPTADISPTNCGATDSIRPSRYMVLEANSRPAIRDNYTLAAYAKAFTVLAAERG